MKKRKVYIAKLRKESANWLPLKKNRKVVKRIRDFIYFKQCRFIVFAYSYIISKDNNGYRRRTLNASERADVGTIVKNQPTFGAYSGINYDKTASGGI